MDKSFLLGLQILLGIVLSGLILIQGKGAGLGASFGGTFATYSTKRGVEKIVFNLTIFLAIFFFLSSIAQLLIG